MNKLPIHTPPTHDPRLSLPRRPTLPMAIRDMSDHSRHLAQAPALRARIARDPHVLFESLIPEAGGAADADASASPWFGRMRAVQMPGFVAASNEQPVVVNAAANVNAAVNVNAVTKVNVAAVANAAVVNRVVLVNKNWVFGVETQATEAWARRDLAMAAYL